MKNLSYRTAYKILPTIVKPHHYHYSLALEITIQLLTFLSSRHNQQPPTALLTHIYSPFSACVSSSKIPIRSHNSRKSDSYATTRKNPGRPLLTSPPRHPPPSSSSLHPPPPPSFLLHLHLVLFPSRPTCSSSSSANVNASYTSTQRGPR